MAQGFVALPNNSTIIVHTRKGDQMGLTLFYHHHHRVAAAAASLFIQHMCANRY